MIHLGLTGYPLGHSLSPKIHTAALKACGLKGDYALFPIAAQDLQSLKELLDSLRSGEITGLNITIPHKQTIIQLLDELTQPAKSIGAVNTIYSQNGNLTGDNTDAAGFMIDLKKFLANEVHGSQGKALVLGAGGAARAVVYALLKDGWQVILTARNPEQGRLLVAQFPGFNTEIVFMDYSLTASHTQMPAISLLINATSVGMSPHGNQSPWSTGLPFPENAVVYDLVYKPRQTQLVRQARAAGLPATTGLGMLVEQAALAFEIWTGHIPPRSALFEAISEYR
jgi:shikimate dehydrogenase